MTVQAIHPLRDSLKNQLNFVNLSQLPKHANCEKLQQPHEVTKVLDRENVLLQDLVKSPSAKTCSTIGLQCKSIRPICLMHKMSLNKP